MSQVGRTPVHVQQSLRHPSWFLSHAPTEAVPDIVLPKGSWRLTTRMKERHSLQSFKAPQPQENAESPHNCWAALDFKLGVTLNLFVRFPLNICASSSPRVLFHFDGLRIFSIGNKRITDPLHHAGGSSVDNALLVMTS